MQRPKVLRGAAALMRRILLFPPMGEFPFAPPLNRDAETRRDFPERWAPLGPNLGDVADPEGPLPPNPKLVPPRE